MNNPKTRKIPLLLLLLMTCSLGLQAAVSTVVTASFCEPTSYLFGCRVLSTTGVYYDTLQSAALTDSIVELRLTIGHKDATTAVSATITEGEDYLFGCRTLTGLTAAGSPYEYKDTLPNVTGCDSVVTLTLTVNPATPPCVQSPDVAVSATITEGEDYLFGCKTITGLTAAGSPYTYYDSLTNVCGADSVIVLTLTVNPATPPCTPSADTPISASITEGQKYLFGCQVLTVAGTYTDTLTNVCGEDSVIVLTLTVNSACSPSADTPISASITEGQSYLFGCQVLTVAGTYTDTLENVCGEDSVIVLTLTVNSACTPSADTPISASITEGQSYLFGCQVLTAAGTYTDTLENVCGEDSVIVLTLTVNSACSPSADTPISASITEGQSYLFGCQVLTVTGTYTDTLTNVCGEDSVIVLTLTVNSACTPSADTPISATIKEGEDYLFGCQTITGLTAAGSPYTYTDTLTNVCGEDSVIVLTLTVNSACSPSADTPIAASITEGESYLFGCQVLTVAGTYTDTLTNVCGEDSVIVLTLTVNSACTPSADTPISASITEGQSYLFGCQVLTVAGTYTDTLTNVCGEDSVIVLTLTVNSACTPSADTPISATIKEGEDYLFGCQTITGLTSAGSPYTYTDTLKNVCGEDSVIVLTLTVNSSCVPSPDTNIKDTIMIGPESYLFGCQIFTPMYGGDTILTDTLQNMCGADSVVVLQLHVIDVLPPTPCAPVMTLLFDTIMLGDTYLFGCQIITPADTGTYNYSDDLVRVGTTDCDSTVYLSLRVENPCAPSPVTAINASIKSDESYLFGCQVIVTPSVGVHTYNDTLTNVCGADSVVTLTLTVYEATPCLPSSYAYNDTVLMNTDYLFGCTVYNFGMVCDTALHDTLSNYCGNDSVVTLNLHVYGYVETDKIDTVCAGTTFRGHTITADSTVFRDTTATLVPGTPDTITNWTVYIYDIPVPARMDSLANVGALPTAKQGCVIDVDPAILINYMNANRATGKTETVVDVEWQYKTAPSASYEPIDNTTKLAKDVDSIIVHYVITETECGTTVLHGGDTVIYCSAYEYRESTTVEQDTICDGDTLTWHGKKYAVAGIYKDSVTKSETTCNYDSIYTLNLTVRSATIIPEEWKVCQDELPVVWHSKTYTAAGIYGDTVKYNASTCDSIRYELTLIVQSPTDMSAEDSVVCEADMPIVWRGQTITAAGTYHDTLHYATGCDSVRYTLNLTVQTATDATATDTTACESDATLNWRGKTWTVADTTYYDTLRYAATGCDSVRYTLNITVQKAIDAAATDSIVCEADMPIVWRGQNITAAGTYYDTLHYATGCDSVRYTLNLTVQTATDATATDTTACESDATLTWRGKVWTVADTTYYDTLYYAATGCDSVRYTLNVTVQKATEVVVDSIVCEAEMPIVWRGQNITAAGIYYDTLYYTTGCDSVRYTLNLTVRTAIDAPAVDMTACEGDATLSWRGKSWPVADTTYYDTLYYATGCDSIRYTLNVTVQRAAYATVEMDTICPGDTYTWHGYTFAEAGTYYDTLYYTTGCDSLIYQLDLAVWTVQQTDSLPAGAEYGMLVMVNRVKLRQDWNIDLTDDMTDKVLWYRVVGAVDEWLDMTTHLDPVNNPTDQDVFLGNGFYYTDGRNILPGEYYAVIDWALPTDAPCYTIWRTEVLTPQTPDAAPIRLLPNRVENGQTMLLTGIDLMGGTTTVRMISASGQTMETIVLDNEVQTELTAEGVPGVYLLRVDNEMQHETLKYIIVK